jgi:transcriptional regulator with XRE-family HTH domain
MESVGKRLKKLRLEKGITIEEVHKKTKIHLDILRSIEDDSFVNINPVYLKGFLKIYCTFLGVNPQEYLTGYKESGGAIKSSFEEEKPRRFLEPVMVRRSFLNTKIIFIIVSVIALVFSSIGLVHLTKTVSSKLASFAKKTKPAVQAKSPQVKKPRLVKSQPKVSVKPVVKSQSSEVVTKKDDSELGIRIGIHALDDCWIQAKVDSRIIFQNVLKKGRFESWTAKDKIELSLGSAGAVQLEVNGKLIPPLGRKGQVLKNIVITKKEGLKIGK